MLLLLGAPSKFLLQQGASLLTRTAAMGVLCVSLCWTGAGQRLIQWEGMDDTEGPTLMKEWHEHLDI